MKVGYFSHFGVQQVKTAANLTNQKFPHKKIELCPLYQDQIKEALDAQQIELAITDPRDNNFSGYQVKQLSHPAVMIFLQAGNYPGGLQTVEKADLVNLPVIIAAKTEEEKGELHYQRDLLNNSSPVIAVENYSEASLMAASGSGYFMMNELTANCLNNDQLQKLYLLDHNQQVRITYAAIYKESNPQIDTFIKFLANDLI